MTMIDPSSAARAPLLERIKKILMQPREEWPRIATEPETIASLYTSYIIPVAGFAVLCAFIDNLTGFTLFGVTHKPTYGEAVTSAVWQFGLQLGGVFVMSLILGYLAPLFGGRNDRLNALKLAAYAATAGWLANVFLLVPWLGFLTLLGLYSLYLIRTGAPALLAVPDNKALPFTAAFVGVGIVLSLVVFGVLQAVAPVGGRSAGGDGYTDARRHAAELERRLSGTADETPANEDTAPSTEPDTEQRSAKTPATAEEAPSSGEGFGGLEGLTKRLERLAKGAEDVKPISPAQLKELLPFDLPGGFKRTETSSSESGMEGMNMATASGVYVSGDKTITLNISDMGAAGAIAGLTSAFGVSSSEEKDGVSRKMSTIDGRMVTEEYDINQNTGMYGVMAADRVMVKADGSNGADIDDLKNAVESVDMRRVEGLAGK
ncbi:MAG: YIP1 family protein [Hyphomicrobium sp.]|nr:YIP1 family protein [Hyphomicrobium sp.]